MITKPLLPPKAGYVEVEIDGERQYQKIRTEQDVQIEVLRADNIAIMEALAEVYELMTGGAS